MLSVGNEFEKTKHQKNRVKYYYQELIKSTYDMCRQNLVMRGIDPSNMIGRNGDTLDLDYPYFSDSDPEGTYEPVFVDACISNPPYSKSYDKSSIENDVRFAEYGLPPESKADYAFLLHGLYHLKSDGVMAIILPHGVLFRGNEEGKIREKLIKKNRIEAIIGIAPNTFFGTGIPVCYIILKKNKTTKDIYFIDASKCYIKDGNKNTLRESDVQKIVDAYISKENIENFARLVPYEEIEENDFNLNISRYVNSDPEPERYDAYGIMNGNIPTSELNKKFEKVWEEFPSLYGNLFKEVVQTYVKLNTEDIIETIRENSEVKVYKDKYDQTINEFTNSLKSYLLDNLMDIDLSLALYEIKDMLFEYLKDYTLIDDYEVYQAFSDIWDDIELDIEEIHTNGFESTRKVKEVYKLKKINGQDEEVFDKLEGQVFPFELVQKTFFPEEKEELDKPNERNLEIAEETNSLIEMLDEEDKPKVLNDKENAFVAADLKKSLNDIFSEIETPEIKGIKEYIDLLDNKAKKDEKLDFMKNHTEVNWEKIEKNKDGTVGKTKLNNYYSELQKVYEFEESSLGYILSTAQALRDEESENKKIIKELEKELEDKTVEKIESLTDDEVYQLLELKWINPINKDLKEVLSIFFSNFEDNLNQTVEKYGESVKEINEQTEKVDEELTSQLSKLIGSDSDMEGINTFINMLGGN